MGLKSYILVTLMALWQLDSHTVTGLCSESACTPSCRYATKNENAVGRCDTNYLNPAFGNDATCVCGDACLPRVFLSSIMAPNPLLACVGAHHQNLCHACPPSTPAQTFVSHICLAQISAAATTATSQSRSSGAAQPQTQTTQSQFCMCMCVGPDEAVLPPQSINSVYNQAPAPQTYSNPYNSYAQYNQYSNPYYGNYGYYGKK